MSKKILFSILLSSLFIGAITTSAFAEENVKLEPLKWEHAKHERDAMGEEREAKLKELESLTLEEWKEERIKRINSVTEEQFQKMKEFKKSFFGGKKFKEKKRVPMEEE